MRISSHVEQHHTPPGAWPSQHGPGARSTPTRSDGRASRRRLLAAAGALLAAQRPFSLTEVARAAGVSPATAYRHFQSAEDVAQAFTAGFVDDFELRAAGTTELAALCSIWVTTILEWGPALAHLRSPEGFLARRRREEPVLLRSLVPLERALGSDEYALSVWNALADPREVLDQHATLGWPAQRIAARLHTSVRAVI